MAELMTASIAAGVADIRLNRPDKINALNHEMFEAIAGMTTRLARLPGLRCVVLSGEGRGFCAGADLDALKQTTALRARTHGEANIYQHAAWGWRQLPVPVIAAVHGFAFGAGFQIMLGADIRIAAPQTQFSVLETHWGLVPDMAGFPLLRGLVRDDVARELIYTARKFLGDEAVKLGLVTRLADDPRGEALALARHIASQSPPAIRAAKRLLNSEADAPALLLAESVEQEALLASAEHAETRAAARENRTAVFGD